jgi:hypothetical protein
MAAPSAMCRVAGRYATSDAGHMTSDGFRSGGQRLGIAALGLVLIACVLSGCSHLQTLKSGHCKSGDPMAGVYLPSRLTVKDACATVSGTVDCVKHEPDGDYHIRLRPDPAYRRLLTAANAYQQCAGEKDPHLVVEIIPQKGEGLFSDNSATDGGFVTPAAPTAGEHVTVTGPLVWDSNILHDLIYPGKDVRNWAEIHPAWNVTVDHSAAPAAAP